jgi:ribosomal protein L29
MTTVTTELRELTVRELSDREHELRREQFDLRMRVNSEASAVTRLRALRKDIARLQTVRREKQKAEGK